MVDQPVPAGCDDLRPVSASAPPSPEREFLDRTVIGWHAVFAVLVAVAAGFLGVDGHAAWIPLVAGLGAAYLVLVVPGGLFAPAVWRGVLFLGLGYATIGVLAWVDPNTLVLLFTLFPLTFATLPRRAAIPSAGVLTVVYTLVLVARAGWSANALQLDGVGGVVGLVFAVIIGLFIEGIVRQSLQRRELIRRLRDAQEELGRSQREAGAAAERERLARDIHDTLAQGFASLIMLGEAAEAALAAGDVEETRRRVAQMDASARDNLAEARALVGAMQPGVLQDRSLAEALQRIATRFEQESGLDVEFVHAGGQRPHPANVDVVLLRATQEALANVRRHSGASRVEVRLGADAEGTWLRIADDGRGFDPAAHNGGYGLAGMRARAAEVGGSLEIASGEGGTTLTVRVP
jgi:signal transduction histidine kinase